MYIDKLYEIMATRQINKNISNFNDATVSASWVIIYLEESKRSLDRFPKNVKKYLEKIENFADECNVDITINLNNINQILQEYENDPKLQIANNVIKEKRSY